MTFSCDFSVIFKRFVIFMLFACDFCCDFVIFVCDFFVISRKVYEIQSVISPRTCAYRLKNFRREKSSDSTIFRTNKFSHKSLSKFLHLMYVRFLN